MPIKTYCRVLSLSLLAGLTACQYTVKENEKEDVSLDALSSAQIRALSCAGCHNPNNTYMHGFEDYTAQGLFSQLQTYQSDPQGQTVMHRLVTGYSEAELRAISDVLTTP